MASQVPGPPPEPAQIRPTGAKLRGWISLRVRLAVLVALVVTLVVGISAYLQIQSFETATRRQLLDTASATAVAAADDVEVQDEEVIKNPDEVADGLREFNEAARASVRWISLIVLDPKTHAPTVYATTSSSERPEALAIGKEAIERKEQVWGDDQKEMLQTVAVPAYWADEVFGSVVVTFSLSSIDTLHKSARAGVIWFVLPTIIALTLLVDLLVRRFIHKPIAAIRRTMQHVAAGDLSARARVIRGDEIGAVADGLNEMLAEMENFNVALQARIREATQELRNSNAELVESYERVFTLREALARAEQMAAVGQTAASVAHQVGTPLNLISGYVQILLEESGADSRIASRLEIVQEQIAKVTTIVRTMLDHARRPMPRQPTNVAQMIERVCAVARPKLDAMGIRMVVTADQTVPPVMADAVQLELALLNLITNALDAMTDGGVLSIAVQATPAGALISVSDTGTGITPDLLPRIFDPWVTTKRAGHGSGLGLSITRDVVNAHGGTIAVSTEYGSGATFTIDLPAAPDGAGEPAADEEHPAVG